MSTPNQPHYTPSEMMIVAAARALGGVRTVFVGVGLPNIACNLARHTVAPQLELIYEAGVYGARPSRLPLSIGDPTLVSGATSVVSMADLFGLYLQGGLVEAALLGGAQVDRFGNLNSTVIGDYAHPKVRLPGSGGATEIATGCRRIFIVMRHSPRAFVEKLAFLTSLGHGRTGRERRALGLTTEGPVLLVSDLCTMRPDAETKELQVVSLHPGVTRDDVTRQTGWPVRFAELVVETPAPTPDELEALRALNARTAEAHGVSSSE